MEAQEKCLRSYLQHSLLFKGPAGHQFAQPVLIPASTAEKPYAIVTDDQLSVLMEDTTFKSMYDTHLVKILPSIPAQFQDVATTLVAIRSENGDLKGKVASLEAANAAKEAELAELRALIKDRLSDQSKALSPEEIAKIQAHSAEKKD